MCMYMYMYVCMLYMYMSMYVSVTAHPHRSALASAAHVSCRTALTPQPASGDSSVEEPADSSRALPFTAPILLHSL